jgi:hypothetical protein
MAEQDPSFVLSKICNVFDLSIRSDRAWIRSGPPNRKRLMDSPMLASSDLHAELKGA